MKNCRLFFSLVIHMSALWWGLTALKFSFTWVRRKGPQDPPNMKKSIYFFHILGLNLKIVSLFDMYIDMGERIAGKQDRPSLIIEDHWRPPHGPLNSPKYIFFLNYGSCMKNWFSNYFPLLYICLHCDEGCICWPWYPWILCRGPTWPQIFYFFLFQNSKCFIILLLYLACKLI